MGKEVGIEVVAMQEDRRTGDTLPCGEGDLERGKEQQRGAKYAVSRVAGRMQHLSPSKAELMA